MKPESDTGLLEHCVALLRPSYPQLPPSEADIVIRDVARLVSAHIGMMPRFLRHPYVMALWLFDTAAIFRYGHRFRRLDVTRQWRHLASWADSSFAPARDVVKALRSCVLLHYLDHDLVLAHMEAERVTAPAYTAAAI